MEKLFIPISLFIMILILAACVTPGPGSERGMIENRTDEKITEFYWTVDYSCKGRRWSTIGYSDVGHCGERHHIIKPDKDGRFKIPSAIFFTMLLEPDVDRSCALRHKGQENNIYNPVNILDRELYKKTYMLILDKKTFSFTIDPHTVSQMLDILQKNGYQVNENDSVLLTYSLKYQDDKKILWDFYTNQFSYTFKAIKEQKTISSTGYIARPDIEGMMIATIKLELPEKNSSQSLFEYKFTSTIKSGDFAKPVTLSLSGRKLVDSFRSLVIQRSANSLLSASIDRDDTMGVMKALRNGADPSCREGNKEDGVPVFWRAVQHHNYAIVKALMDAGTDINIIHHQNETPLGEAFFQAGHHAGQREREEANNAEKIIELLLNRGAKADPDTELMWQACRLHRFDFIPLLVKNGADLNYLLTGKDRQYRIPTLHIAACNESPRKALPIIDYLVRKGTPVNIRDEKGNTALHAAMNSGFLYSDKQQYEVIKKLVSYGADMNTVNDEGNMPLHTLSGRVSLYHYAWLRNRKRDAADIKEVEEILMPVVRFLAKKGADLNAYDKSGRTPLHLCAENNNSETALALIKGGADIDRLTSGPGNWPGYSALHLAAFRTNMETIKVLVENGADLNLKTRDGQTIFNIAKTHDHPDGRLKNYLEQFPENR